MPKVLRDRLERSGGEDGGGANGSRSFSTSARQLQPQRDGTGQELPAETEIKDKPHTSGQMSAQVAEKLPAEDEPFNEPPTSAYMSQQPENEAELLAEGESGFESTTDQLTDTVAAASESENTEQWFDEDEVLEPEPTLGTAPSRAEVAEMIAAASGENPLEAVNGKESKAEGLKFDAPTMPLPRTEHLRRRYDPVVDHFTKMIMWDGKLAQAQKVLPKCSLVFTTAQNRVC